MSRKFSFIILLLVNYFVASIETMHLFPLNDDLCKEILRLDNVDISDVQIKHYDLDAKSTIHAGQSPYQEVFRLFIEYEKNSQPYSTQYLVIEPIASLVYNFMYSYGVYEKEYVLYSQVFAEMAKLEGEHFAPRFIAGDDTEYINTLILEDVYSLGYKTPHITKPLTLDQCKAVFEKLAKFHALSVILDKRGLLPEMIKTVPKPRNEFEKEDQCKDCDKANAYFDQGMSHFVENLNAEIKEKYSDRLDQMKNNISEKVNDGMEGSLHVIAHGNLMAAGILFKHNDDGTIQDVNFIHFTTAKWNPPLIDIFYLAIGAMSFEDVEQHFDTLLEIYSNTMNELFKKYQLDPYTLDDIKSDIRKQHMTFMWICGVVLPLVNNREMPVHVGGYSFEEPLSAENMLTAYSNPKYVDAASKWFMFFVKRGIFDE